MLEELLATIPAETLLSSAVLADPCDGVVCNQPPGPCYNPAGTCSGGQCKYELLPAGSQCSATGGMCDAAGACKGELSAAR